MPEGLGNFETYDGLVYSIKDRVDHGSPVQDLGRGLKKIEGSQTVFYWYQKNDTVLLGVELYKKPQGLVVSYLGKHPDYKGKPPYAVDLYDAVLKDNHRAVRLLSDTQLSDDGRALWKRLLQLGHKVSVYDIHDPGKTFKTFQTSDQMDQYFKHDDADFGRYQYVLSEDGEVLAETRSFFNTRRLREFAGLRLED